MSMKMLLKKKYKITSVEMDQSKIPNTMQKKRFKYKYSIFYFKNAQNACEIGHLVKYQANIYLDWFTNTSLGLRCRLCTVSVLISD